MPLSYFPRKSVVALTAPAWELESRPGIHPRRPVTKLRKSAGSGLFWEGARRASTLPFILAKVAAQTDTSNHLIPSRLQSHLSVSFRRQKSDRVRLPQKGLSQFGSLLRLRWYNYGGSNCLDKTARLIGQTDPPSESNE
jgi:hypothetical protein